MREINIITLTIRTTNKNAVNNKLVQKHLPKSFVYLVTVALNNLTASWCERKNLLSYIILLYIQCTSTPTACTVHFNVMYMYISVVYIGFEGGRLWLRKGSPGLRQEGYGVHTQILTMPPWVDVLTMCSKVTKMSLCKEANGVYAPFSMLFMQRNWDQ